MSLLPNELISDATQEAFPYVAEYAIAPGSLLRRLQALDAEVVNYFSYTAPDRLSNAGATIVISQTQNATGYVLADGRSYFDFRYVTSEGLVYEEPIRIVPETQFFNPPKHPAAVVRSVGANTYFFPADPQQQQWAGTDSRTVYIGNGDTVQYRYVPSPLRVISMTQTLISPDEAREYFQTSLLLSILLGSSAVMAVPQSLMQSASVRAQEARQTLWLLASKRTGVQSSIGR